MSTSLSESQAREEICRVGKSLFDRGYVHATAGNISFRLDDSMGGGYLITPTDACLGFLDPARLARLDANGQHLAGDQPSKTFALHSRIYAAARALDPEVRCVIHTHSAHCVALTLKGKGLHTEPGACDELLPAITPYFVMKVGHVPVIAYAHPGAAQTADSVQRAIESYGGRGIALRAVMLERLGPNVWHHSPAQAMAVLEELEESARLYFLCGQKVEPLKQRQLDLLCQTFKVRW